jgi:hypothetical protein
MSKRASTSVVAKQLPLGVTIHVPLTLQCGVHLPCGVVICILRTKANRSRGETHGLNRRAGPFTTSRTCRFGYAQAHGFGAGTVRPLLHTCSVEA